MSPFLRQLEQSSRDQRNYVVITVVACRGSVPTVAGAKLAVSGQDLLAGTVGGGKIEASAIAHASTVTRTDLVTWNLQKDVGMTCGGEMTLYFERFGGPVWEIAIFGAGHVAQALVRVLLPLDCRIRLRDTRENWIADLPEAPNLDAKATDDLAAEVEQLAAGTFVLCMTKGHSTDLPILAEALRLGRFPYLGVIGSKSKSSTLRKELREQHGLADAEFRCPMGLPIGDNTPAEIAISMAAELLQQRDRIAK